MKWFHALWHNKMTRFTSFFLHLRVLVLVLVLVISSSNGFDFGFPARNFSPRVQSPQTNSKTPASCSRTDFLWNGELFTGKSVDLLPDPRSIYYYSWSKKDAHIALNKKQLNLYGATNKMVDLLRNETGLSVTQLTVDEDTYAPVGDLITKAGYVYENVTVTTEKGYQLTLWRLPCSQKESKTVENPKNKEEVEEKCKPARKRAVLIQHGLLMSGIDWLFLDNNSLPYMLAEANYDVCIGNARGNKYSRTHTNSAWNPNVYTSKYWEFGVHEMAVEDLPETFKTIQSIRKTKNADLNKIKIDYVGYSMGTTEYFIYRGFQPLTDPYIRRAVAMAPAAYIGNLKTPFSLLAILLPLQNKLLPRLLLGLQQLLASGRDGPVNGQIPLVTSPSDQVNQLLAPLLVPVVGEILSNPSLTMLLCDGSPVVKNRKAFQRAMGHSPAGGSLRTVNHFIQLYKANLFQRFQPESGLYVEETGFLVGDRLKGGKAGKYNLNFNGPEGVPLLIIYGTNDSLTVPQDVMRTGKEVGAQFCAKALFNHLDFLYGPEDECRGVYEKVIEWFKMEGTTWDSTKCDPFEL